MTKRPFPICQKKKKNHWIASLLITGSEFRGRSCKYQNEIKSDMQNPPPLFTLQIKFEIKDQTTVFHASN